MGGGGRVCLVWVGLCFVCLLVCLLVFRLEVCLLLFSYAHGRSALIRNRRMFFDEKKIGRSIIHHSSYVYTGAAWQLSKRNCTCHLPSFSRPTASPAWWQGVRLERDRPGFDPRFPQGAFSQVVSCLWLENWYCSGYPCQAFGSALGLLGLVSVYCD